MRRALKFRLAQFIFWIADTFCKAELQQIIGEVAMTVASQVSIQATRASFIREGVAVCRHETCTQRFGLRRTSQGWACQLHAVREPLAAAI